MSSKKLIYASDARRAILKAEPRLAYIIDNIPSVEAELVVHTSWEQKPRGEHGFYEERCRACGEWSLGMNKPYCPMCGAKADGGANDVK